MALLLDAGSMTSTTQRFWDPLQKIPSDYLLALLPLDFSTPVTTAMALPQKNVNPSP
jgi:hypothetical protein